nr:zinc finger, CCHC-type [Tanacetum cinerariifolium]
ALRRSGLRTASTAAKPCQGDSLEFYMITSSIHTDQQGTVGCKAVVILPDPKLKTLGERGIECIFVGYAEHSKDFRFYVIKPTELVLISLIIKSRDVIFEDNRFSSVSKLSLRIPDRTKDISSLVVPEEVIEEVVTQQPKHELRKSNRNRISNNFGPEFQLYLIEGRKDKFSDQHS